MTALSPSASTRTTPTAAESLAVARTAAWAPAPAALAAAAVLVEAGEGLREPRLTATAHAVQAAVALRHGDLVRAFEAVEAAAASVPGSADPLLAAQVAAARSRLAFFCGDYHEALALADEAVALADSQPAGPLQLDARLARNLVLGNLMPGAIASTADDLLELALRLDDPRAEAIARNDRAVALLYAGRPDEAAQEADAAVAAALALGGDDAVELRFAYGTRAEVRLGRGDPAGAVADAETAVALADPEAAPEPYLDAMLSHVLAQALVACDRVPEALEVARRALTVLGTALPFARTLLLRQVADCLRAAGRHEQAFAALAAASELERRAAAELTVRHNELRRTAGETRSARRDAALLASANAELEGLVARLEEAQAERARLLARTVEVAEDERIRVAIELHDGPIQQLTVVALNLDRLALRIARGERERLAPLVETIRAQLADEMKALRRLMAELRPPIIDQGGLGAALADCAREVLAGTGAAFDVRCDLGGARLARELETVVYRVVREGVVNAAEHGAAARVEVVVEPAGEELRLVVADDGCGFDEAEAAARGPDQRLGLLGMQERVESVGGVFRLRSAPGAGTCVEATLPLKLGVRG